MKLRTKTCQLKLMTSIYLKMTSQTESRRSSPQPCSKLRLDHWNVPPQKLDQLLAFPKPLTTEVGDFFSLTGSSWSDVCVLLCRGKGTTRRCGLKIFRRDFLNSESICPIGDWELRLLPFRNKMSFIGTV